MQRCVKDHIAHLQAQASNSPLEDPVKLLVKKTLGDFEEPLMEAARLQIFIDVLLEVSDPKYAFQTTKLIAG